MSAVHFLLRKLSICRVFFPKLERFVLLIGAVIFCRLGLKKRKGPEENMSHANDISCKKFKMQKHVSIQPTVRIPKFVWFMGSKWQREGASVRYQGAPGGITSHGLRRHLPSIPSVHDGGRGKEEGCGSAEVN